jgi:hypothetical protein
LSRNSNSDDSSLESRFYIALGRYMQTFSYLELNLGLCIRFLVNRKDPQAAHPLLERLSTQQKLDVLKELIFYKYANDKSKMISDFGQWFKKAAKTKASRNRYVHGVWELVPHLKETPIRFRPISWAAGTGKPMQTKDEVQYIALSDFEKIVAEMNAIFREFSELREKYGI